LIDFGLIDLLLNLMDLMMSFRRRIPAMIRAMPVDVKGWKMLTRFSLAHAGL
jgi:hypothetical protein